VTHADDDAAAVAGPPTSGPVRAPVPPQAGGPPEYPQQAGGPPVYPQPTPYGPAPGQPPYYGPPQPYGWRPPPVPVAPDGRPLADFGTRLLSYLIDGAIVGGIALVVIMPVFAVVILRLMPDAASGYDPPSDEVFTDFVLPMLLVELGVLLLLVVGYYIYFVEMMYRSGQTVGKKLMKIRVVPLEPGATLTRGMAAQRYLIQFVVAMIVPFFSYLDGFWQLWDKPYQQTLHDKVAKTVVVKVAP